MKNRLFRYSVYFRQGHGVYLIFLVTFLNFVVIQYRLLVEKVPSLLTLFPQLYIFIITFLAIYFPLAIIIGWLDYKRGSVPIQATIAAQVSPYAQDLAKGLTLHIKGENKEAIETLKKWTKK